MVRTIVHVLAVRPAENGSCTTRGTLRAGDVFLGQSFRFSGSDGSHHCLRVKESNTRGHKITLISEGDDGDIQALRSGLYLYGEGEVPSPSS